MGHAIFPKLFGADPFRTIVKSFTRTMCPFGHVTLPRNSAIAMLLAIMP